MRLVLSLCSPSRSTSRTSIMFSKISLSVGHCSFRYIAARSVAGKTSPRFSLHSYPVFPYVLGSVLFSEMPIKTLASGLVKGQAIIWPYLYFCVLLTPAQRTDDHLSRRAVKLLLSCGLIPLSFFSLFSQIDTVCALTGVVSSAPPLVSPRCIHAFSLRERGLSFISLLHTHSRTHT